MPEEKQPDPEAENGLTKPIPEQVPEQVQEHVQVAASKLQSSLAGAPIGPKTKWIIGLAISVLGAVAYPAATGISTYADKRATRETATATKQADALASQRKMQADLLKRVIAVAERATLKDPTSIFQLGLIAGMVNENEPAFGIKLQDAERTMKRMFDSLAPVAGLRRRVAESNRLLQQLRTKDASATKRHQKLLVAADGIRTKLASRVSTWQRKRLTTALQELQGQRQQYQVEHLFYSSQIKREQSLKRYFGSALQRQEDTLKRRLQQTTLLRQRLQLRTQRFSYLVTALKIQSKMARSIALELRTIMLDVEQDNETAQQTITRLSSELSSERQALDMAKQTLERLKIKLDWHRLNQTIVAPPILHVGCSAKQVRKLKIKKRYRRRGRRDDSAMSSTTRRRVTQALRRGARATRTGAAVSPRPRKASALQGLF